MAAFPTCIAWPLSFVETYQGIILAVDQIKNFTQQIVARYSYFLIRYCMFTIYTRKMKCPFRKNININILAIFCWNRRTNKIFWSLIDMGPSHVRREIVVMKIGNVATRRYKIFTSPARGTTTLLRNVRFTRLDNMSFQPSTSYQ